MLPFEFVINGAPVSQQARRRDRVRQWVEEVRAAAQLHWPDAMPPIAEPIMLTIIYFHDNVSIDVDNIPKPILDALKGLVYFDDNQVTDIVCRKRSLNSDLRIENPTEVLAQGLDTGREFLYIMVDEAPDQGVIS